MAVPSPSIVLVPAPGSVYRGSYEGPLGVPPGVNQPLHIDLKYLPVSIRESLYFRDQYQLLIKSLADGFFHLDPAEITNVNFFDTPGQPNEYVQVFVSSITGTEQCLLDGVLLHSTIR